MNNLSFIINTSRNEKEYIKLLLFSLYHNLSHRNHEIIVFVDSDNQNTTEFLLTQKKFFPNLRILKNLLPIPIGYQLNINLMFERATNEIVSLLQSDMIISPNYDINILKHLDEKTILSATRIEPPLHPPGPEKIIKDFGTDPESFLSEFEEFCRFSESSRDPDKITNYYFAPFTCYKKVWMDIGGHDTIFRRSREDSDVLWRLVLNGTDIKQTWNALVYHFTCTSSRGIKWWEGNQNFKNNIQSQADQIELRKFIRKWGTFKHPVNLEEANHWRYQIGANITNVKNTEEHISILLQMFYLFDKIYIDNPDVLKVIMEEFYKIHIPANTLFGYEKVNWEKYKHIFNALEADQIYRSTPIMDRDVIVHVDLPSFLQNQDTQHALAQINDILHDSLEEGDSGDFEVNGITIHVKELRNRIRENIYVHNPKLGDGLIEL